MELDSDKRPQRYGWAPGDYTCRCHDCKEQFIGDKRAILCARCAYMRPDSPVCDADDLERLDGMFDDRERGS